MTYHLPILAIVVLICHWQQPNSELLALDHIFCSSTMMGKTLSWYQKMSGFSWQNWSWSKTYSSALNVHPSWDWHHKHPQPHLRRFHRKYQKLWQQKRFFSNWELKRKDYSVVAYHILYGSFVRIYHRSSTLISHLKSCRNDTRLTWPAMQIRNLQIQ